jgi:hypothetical protein
MRNLRFGCLGVAVLATSVMAASEFDYLATWGYDDADGRLTIDLRADGKCFIFALDNRTAASRRVDCTYWIHGGRVKLRVRGARDGEGLNNLQIEHLRDTNTLVILGATPKILKRQAPETRGE